MTEKGSIYYAWKETEPKDKECPYKAIYPSEISVALYFGKFFVKQAIEQGKGKIVKVRITEVKEK
jgi:hypothetical protein